MNHAQAWIWIVLFGLGAYHGINPGMGWLFAVALGMQRQSGRAVWQALLPIAAGHAVSIAVIVAVGLALGAVLPISYIRIFVACTLLGFGIYRLIRKGHPRWGGMQVGFLDLTIWSFLMASAHGAGFMLLPLTMGSPHTVHLHEISMPVLAIAVHTAGYMLMTGVAAFVVYKYVGLMFLRKAWVNLDLLWAAALIVTAGAALVL